MHKLSIDRDALKFVQSLDAKQYRQVFNKILSLLSDPTPADSIAMKEYIGRRTDIGEYRIVYRFEPGQDTVFIDVVDKRNDDEVYRHLKRKK